MEKDSSKPFVLSNYLILVIDICIIVASLFLAYLVRFNFSIPLSELKPLPLITLYVIMVRIVLFMAGRSYTGIIQYVTIVDMLKLYLYTILGSVIFLLTNVVSYYFINQTLFIPLTIIILEFLITSFLLVVFRGVIEIRYSVSRRKNQLDGLRGH